jgi:hypothetical protein
MLKLVRAVRLISKLNKLKEQAHPHYKPANISVL